MPYYHTRICPICQKAGVQDISRHLRQTHKLSSPEERKPYLQAAWFQLQNDSNVLTNSILSISNRSKAICGKAPAIKGKAKPAKALLPVVINQVVADKNRLKTWTSHSSAGFKFKHPFCMQVVGPTSCGKTHFVRQVLKTPELKHFCVEWYYNQSQHEYDVYASKRGKVQND